MMNTQMRKMQQGFTLIELMIVVAIIGILAAIAIPAYTKYTAKAKVAAALAEVAAGKTAFEVLLNEGAADADITLATIGLKSPTANCTTTVTGGTAGTITCAIQNSPTAAGNLVLTRVAATGTWNCTYSGTIEYAPKGCVAP